MGTALCRVPPEVCAAIYAIANIVYSRTIYGQFQPIDKRETEQERRRRRSDTFAVEMPKDYIRTHWGRGPSFVHLLYGTVVQYTQRVQ